METTRPDYRHFELFGPEHLCSLAIYFAAMAAAVLFYRKLDEKGRRKFLFAMTVLLVADELLKHLGSAATGQWEVGFLPLHLCSINIFMCIINAFRHDDFSAEVLYATCLPGAFLAILMPTWTSLPFWNFMSIHSSTVHVLLVLYPLLLLSGGFRPDIRRLPKVFGLLICECIPIFFLNKLWDTNFFFLHRTENNPILEFFAKFLGDKLYILGMPLILAAVWAVMYLPWYFYGKKKAEV